MVAFRSAEIYAAKIAAETVLAEPPFDPDLSDAGIVFRLSTCGRPLRVEEVPRVRGAFWSIYGPGGHEEVTYADGTVVRENDRVRRRQTPGGVLPPAKGPDGESWRVGVATYLPLRFEDPGAWGVPSPLVLLCEGRHYSLAGHVIEPA